MGIHKVKDENEVISIINENRFGLTTSIYSKDVEFV